MAKEIERFKMKHRNSFVDVLLNIDDQVIVRQLLEAYVPQYAQEKIIAEFNAHVDRFNARQTS